MKRIACLGNMNNNLFQIGRYLVDCNYDVTFFLFEEFEHFKPSADIYGDVSQFQIYNLNWSLDTLFDVSGPSIKKLLSKFDVLIGTDVAPAFLTRAGIALDVFVPHGSDLYDYPFAKFKNKPPQLWELAKYLFSQYQFTGIRCAKTVAMDPSEVVYEEPLAKIKGKHSFNRIMAMPFLYLPQYKLLENYCSDKVDEFKRIRGQYTYVFFQHGSQDWSNRGPFKINKGNDILIKGFAKYLETNHSKEDSILVLVEYGHDVNKSKQLIYDLGISQHVVWLPKLNRKDIMKIISEIDIGIGELGYRRWYSYGCIMEYMALGKPVIHHRNDEYYRSLHADLYPMYNASTAEEVCHLFLSYRSNKTQFVENGLLAQQWMYSRTKQSINIIENIVTKKSNDNTVNVRLTYFRKVLNMSFLYYLLLYYFYRGLKVVRRSF